ncbi:MAG TPA: response regulator transcription factor [Mucilaginibacter sp.]|nr:response regulator transcription factor [Mucilaginibacter sp.]
MESKQPIAVAIVDDHTLFCRSMEVMINRLRGYTVVFTASDGLDFIHKIKTKEKPDIVIMDRLMPIMDGASTILWLKQNYPEVSVISLSVNYSEEAILKTIKSGVKGYLLKDAELDEFKAALESVAKGGLYYPEFVTHYLLKSVNKSVEINTDLESLKPHEIDFIRLASSELTYKEIADQMNVSLRTVDGYRDHLFQKLNIKSRVGLVLFAIKYKII